MRIFRCGEEHALIANVPVAQVNEKQHGINGVLTFGGQHFGT